MKITPLLYQPACCGFNLKSKLGTLTRSPLSDCFIRSPKTPYKTFLSKEDKFQISDYNNLEEEDKRRIRLLVDEDTMEASSKSVPIAKALEAFLNDKYGENNYVFVSIGTSPSMIAKVFECSGIETKYLPISGLGEEYFDVESAICDPDFFKKYGDFLKTQGLYKKAVDKNPKTFVFYDFTSTSETLKRFEEIMIERFNLPYDKMVFRSVNEDLTRIFDKSEYEPVVCKYIREYMSFEDAEYYSSVNHLHVSKIKDAEYIPKNLSCHDKKRVKLFNFSIMDILDKYDELKYNPKNKNIL